jgi:hypothetical protein
VTLLGLSWRSSSENPILVLGYGRRWSSGIVFVLLGGFCGCRFERCDHHLCVGLFFFYF